MKWSAKSVARTGGEHLPWVATVVNDYGDERTDAATTCEGAVVLLNAMLSPAKPSIDAAASDDPEDATSVDVGTVAEDATGARHATADTVRAVLAPTHAAHDVGGTAVKRGHDAVVPARGKHR